MCIEQTIWYPCRTHAAMKPITQYCPRFESQSQSSSVARARGHCGNVKDLDSYVAQSLRAHLDEPCPHGCKTRAPIRWTPLVKSGSKRVRRSLVSGLERAKQGLKKALR
ncbi:hypothetical protein PG996_000044 [Apiospora saccharicola]|uniref:Uncharacterized protein n=1 Tax=Apiospora saccharicola TaxID=335842 RepID=A0ABR1WCW6_9PEZI